MKDLLKRIEAEIAQITDVQQRQAARERLTQLWEKYSGDDRVVTMAEVVATDKLASTGLRTYATGFSGLDELLVAFRDTELITIAGPTKNGKTTLAMSITANLLRAGHVPCWFSYEMTPLEFAEKMGDAPLPQIYTPRILHTNSTAWVEEKIIEAIAKYDAQVFFLDHLHYVCDLTGKTNENTSVRIGRAMRELKRLAVDWNICLVLLAHTVKIKPTEEPTVASLRDSSFIAQESNTVLYVRREGEETSYSNKSEVFVIANRRNGNNGSTGLIYDHDSKMLMQEYAV